MKNDQHELTLLIRSHFSDERQATAAHGLVQAVLNADTAQVPGIIGGMTELLRWTDPLLREEYAKSTATPREKLHASLALLPVDATQVDYLAERLLAAEPSEVPVIREALAPHKAGLIERLWAVVTQ